MLAVPWPRRAGGGWRGPPRPRAGAGGVPGIAGEAPAFEHGSSEAVARRSALAGGYSHIVSSGTGASNVAPARLRCSTWRSSPRRDPKVVPGRH